MQRLHYKSRDFFVYRFLSVYRDFTINLETFLYRYFLMYSDFLVLGISQHTRYFSSLLFCKFLYLEKFSLIRLLETSQQRFLRSRDFLVQRFQISEFLYLENLVSKTSRQLLQRLLIVYSGRDFLVQRFLLSLNL